MGKPGSGVRDMESMRRVLSSVPLEWRQKGSPGGAGEGLSEGGRGGRCGAVVRGGVSAGRPRVQLRGKKSPKGRGGA